MAHMVDATILLLQQRQPDEITVRDVVEDPGTTTGSSKRGSAARSDCSAPCSTR